MNEEKKTSRKKEIIFTSGVTESIGLAIQGFIQANRNKNKHVITLKTEHSAVLNNLKYLEKCGISATYLDVKK